MSDDDDQPPNVGELLEARIRCATCGTSHVFCGLLALCPKCDELAVEFYHRNKEELEARLIGYLKARLGEEDDPQARGILTMLLEVARNTAQIDGSNGK